VPAPAWENLDVFLQTAEFAVVAEITSKAGAVRLINGIFDEPFLDAQLGEYRLDTVQPRLLCTEVALAGVARGETVVIEGVTYITLSGAKPDGTGMATLELVKQEAGGAAF